MHLISRSAESIFTTGARSVRVSRSDSFLCVSNIRKASAAVPGADEFRDYNSDDYQFLHKSIVPTYHFQKSLRRLPIPSLENSCRRYYEAAKPIFDDQAMAETKELLNDFMKSEGPILNVKLIEHDLENLHTSYVSEPWFQMYLSARVPCPINYNPFMMFAPDPDVAYNEQLVRATNFVISCGRFKRALDAEVLEPEVYHMDPTKSDTELFHRFCRMIPPRVSWYGAVLFKAFPLDMSQYKSLFGGCRIPQRGIDRLHLRTDSRHFVVVRNGTFYSVQLFDDNGKLLPPECIHACLHRILQEPSEVSSAEEESVGSLTTLDRDTWTMVRQEMIAKSARNLESLVAIEDALFILCLDQLASNDPLRLMQSLLCGDDGRNRWFDKCFQLIVDGNGQATINFEHSWGDGVAVLRLMEETLKDTTKHRFVVSGQKPSEDVLTMGFVQKLDWELNDSLRANIKGAQKLHKENCEKLDFGVMEHKELNKTTIKEAKLSPDAVMQLGIQMAFYDLYKEFVPTYESCSTAAFLKGRTECIRSATNATKEAVLAFEAGTSDANKLMELVRKCSDAHSKLVKEAAMGQGFDRHFFGLRQTAQRLGREPHSLFTHQVYQQMGNFVLSTSTLSTNTIQFGGFGPAVPDGFGVGYNVSDQRLGAVVTAYKDKRNSKQFCEALNACLKKIKHVIDVAVTDRK